MRIFTYIRDRHALIYKVALFLLTISLIIYQFPREGKFRYDIEKLKGRPWPHEDLMAPFSFAVLKSEEEVTSEREVIITNSKLYYTCNTSVAADVRSGFSAAFHTAWEQRAKRGFSFLGLFGGDDDADGRLRAREKHLALAAELLDEICRRGVLQPDDRLEGRPPGFSLVVLRDNIAEEVELQQLFTAATAREHLRRSLQDAGEGHDADFLLEVIAAAIRPDVFFDDHRTKAVLDDELKNLSLTRGMVQEGERILSRGELVDGQKHMVLTSLKQEYEARLGGSANHYYILAGQVILVSLSMLVLAFFLYIFRRDIIIDNVQVTFLLLALLLTVTAAAVAARSGLSLYLVPFCVLPIIVRAFYDTRLAFFTHLTAVLISSILAPNGFEFVFLQFVAGNAAIYSLANMRRRSQFFLSALLIFTAYSVTYLGILIIQEGETFSVDRDNIKWFGCSALLVLLAYPLIYLFEKVFGLVSDVTLMELADLNSPLLRRLSSEAQGTFQHSMQVANLAEEAIFAIGGDALLVRTGALYHDIGKLNNPMFFIENQIGGMNPHDDLGEKESAAIIIGHVIDGIELAKRKGLPDKVIDFIRTHHGTMRTEYFYRKYRQGEGGKEEDDASFRYPGPIPFSKETAVLMMADACEAASRSLQKPDAAAIARLVDDMIDAQMEEGQFRNANITLKDISAIRKIFTRRLMTVYHVRIAYPEQSPALK